MGNVEQLCFRASKSTQDLEDFKQTLFHYIEDCRIYYVLREGFLFFKLWSMDRVSGEIDIGKSLVENIVNNVVV